MTTQQVTPEDLKTAMRHVRVAATRVGIREAYDWHLEAGSKAYGKPYRLWRIIGTEHHSPIINGNLGMTAAEAFRTLQVLRNAFAAVEEAN